MKKTKKLKTWVGKFKNMDGNILGENFLDGNFLGGNFPGGSLVDGNFPGGNFLAGSFPDPVFISWLFSHEVCIHIQCFFGFVRNKLQTLNISFRCWNIYIFVLIFGFAEIRLDKKGKINFEIYNITDWATITIHILPNILRSRWIMKWKWKLFG